MDHVVYLDAKAKEFEKLIEGTKTMIIRGATGRKMPYERVFEGDQLYFIRNNGEGLFVGKAKVSFVYNSKKMTKEESIELVDSYKEKLNLSSAQSKRWMGKRYLVLIEVDDLSEIEPFEIDRSKCGKMDDWLPVEDIDTMKKK